MKLIPASDKLIVVEEPEKPNAAGLELARSSKERQQIGIVESVGKDISGYAKGDRVYFTRFNINEAEVPGLPGTFYVMKEDQILFKVTQ